ncbi:hypothetical protein CGRA01v4_11885 [Colletotrichum graminicola]|nr:hypothetical protein CGRA01v4_11885 [Colletotrichum graminicola]
MSLTDSSLPADRCERSRLGRKEGRGPEEEEE